MKQWFLKLWFCWIWKDHDWTSACQKGIPPTTEQLKGGVEGFYDYAKMYCDRCGHVSELSKRRYNNVG